AAWREVARGELKVDSFSVNGRWVPWYNLHKTFAGLRDAWQLTREPLAREMLIDLGAWALALLEPLSDAQLQDLMRAEHGGMNEVFADIAAMSGGARYLRLAERFSHRAILDPLRGPRDALTGLHANTQIPKVIGFARIAEERDPGAADKDWLAPARFFWTTVRERRSVAIGGNSVREHFHPLTDFQPMLDEVEGPETCNTYNMLKLTELLHAHAAGDEERARYADYYERALFNHVLASQHPAGGFVYFTPMRPNHYRVYSQVDLGMWCCVGSGLESHARHG
ncbi:glycosyl hydrolase, partial [Mitsuaria sp. TWR114]|uniref:beta-L-arabinofuranosidase domain-containing protein n=1 Tax=Mitsuaria sp. TWR114 TaxID=2601731 RepID=UPI0011C27877